MNAGKDPAEVKWSAEELVERLRSALRREGDFPASAKVVSELRALTSDPKTTSGQLTEVILREPSLGTRVLHLVNSSFYRRSKPIMTVSQAVVQIGMRPLAEMCAGVVLLQKFVPAARRGGVFANCLQKTILTSLLTGSIAGEVSKAAGGSQKQDETGFLAGSFAEIGTLLLAYYFPQVYDAAVRRATQKKQDIGQSIRELTGLSPLALSREVIAALGLPPFYGEILQVADDPKATTPETAPDVTRMAKSVRAADTLSRVLTFGKSKQELDAGIAAVGSIAQIDVKRVSAVVGGLTEAFASHCHSLDLNLPTLPDYVAQYSGKPGESPAQTAPVETPDDLIAPFIEEIRIAVENRETTSSIITSVMESIAWGLKFDRVLLMLVAPDKKRLVGRMALGEIGAFDPKTFSRPLLAVGDRSNPEVQAFRESRPVFEGEPLLERGWPFVTIPVGYGQHAIGVVYADRIGGDREILNRDQAVIGVLAELLNRSVSVIAKS